MNREAFDTLYEAKVLVERWKPEYNHISLHMSLGYCTPREFLECKKMSYPNLATGT